MFYPMKRRTKRQLKVLRSFKLAPAVDAALTKMSDRTNITKTRLVELALLEYSAKN